ncbi:MAG TPA: AraC family transcriptional regulator [Polyangiaceae bacterium]|jgi:AraC-like DNA-binding protein|nr:AraC family transcriptional regulator [Polyangiaceae bacterium]
MAVFVPMVRALVEVVESAGVSREQLFRRAELDESRILDDGASFEVGEYCRLQEAAIEATGNDALGLCLAEQVSESAFALVAHLITHAPTLKDAIETAIKFGRMVTDGYHLTLGGTPDVASLAYEFPRTSPRSDRMQADFAMAGFLKLIRIFAGPRADATRVSFEYATPRDLREYERIFRGAAHFEQSFTALAFPRVFLSCSPLHTNLELFGVLRAQAEKVLERRAAGQGHAELLRRFLEASVPARIPTMSAAAKEFGISARSLRRRLSEEGVSYRALLQDALEHSAMRMLGETRRSVQETAYAVGFSDPAAFHRAFKRWKGMTPKQFRDESSRTVSAEGTPTAERR